MGKAIGSEALRSEEEKVFSQGFLPKVKKLLGGEKKMNHILRRIVGRARAKEKGKGKGKERRGSDGRDREAAGANLSGIVAVVSVLVMLSATAALATAQQPPTPFHVYGWVKYSNGTAVLGPNVNITNLNTSESYTMETNASYSYYQVITSSCNVSAGDVLNFSASDDGNSANRTATVTPKNMTDGGLFEQNLTIVVQPQGICGDVDNDGYITGGDATKVWDVACHVSPPSILDNPWAADVDCDGFITGGDATKIWDVACHVSPESILHCCP